MLLGLPLLSLAIWVPIVFGVLVLATGADRNATLARPLALVGSVLGFLVTLPLYAQFDSSAGGFQFQELVPWIASFRVNYQLGIDGVSLLLILLNSFTTVLVVIAGWSVIQTRVAQYLASFLFLSGFMNGAFSALDALLFPMNRGSNIAARPGYPSIIVPFGFAPNDADPPFPAGFVPLPSPFGVTFVGTACKIGRAHV